MYFPTCPLTYAKKKKSSTDMLKKLSSYSEISARLISKRAASVFAERLIIFFCWRADYKSVIVVVCGRNAGEVLKVRVYYIKQAKIWAYLLPDARHDMFRLRCIIKEYCSTGKEAAWELVACRLCTGHRHTHTRHTHTRHNYQSL